MFMFNRKETVVLVPPKQNLAAAIWKNTSSKLGFAVNQKPRTNKQLFPKDLKGLEWPRIINLQILKKKTPGKKNRLIGFLLFWGYEKTKPS